MKKRLIAILAISCVILTGCTKEKKDNNEYIFSGKIISIEELLKQEEINKDKNLEIHSDKSDQNDIYNLLNSNEELKVLKLR